MSGAVQVAMHCAGMPPQLWQVAVLSQQSWPPQQAWLFWQRTAPQLFGTICRSHVSKNSQSRALSQGLLSSLQRPPHVAEGPVQVPLQHSSPTGQTVLPHGSPDSSIGHPVRVSQMSPGAH